MHSLSCNLIVRQPALRPVVSEVLVELKRQRITLGSVGLICHEMARNMEAPAVSLPGTKQEVNVRAAPSLKAPEAPDPWVRLVAPSLGAFPKHINKGL